ncbi:MAG: hypothetical protein ACUVSG_10310, partial [Anaerolineae bacterium]
ATLAMIGQLLVASGRPQEGIQALEEALAILEEIGARLDAEQVREILATARGIAGPEAPTRPPAGPAPPAPAGAETLTIEEWVRRTVEAARQGGPQAAAMRQLASAVAAAAEAPPELRALAGTLLNILMGNFQPDLSGLPEELARVVQETLGETATE